SSGIPNTRSTPATVASSTRSSQPHEAAEMTGAARLRLDGRVALITGSGGGLGRATALRLAEAGALVEVTDIDRDAAARVTQEVRAAGGRAEAHVLDVTDEAGIARLTAAIADLRGRIDILVNNAGIGARHPSESMPTEAWAKVTAINLTGPFLCAREAG